MARIIWFVVSLWLVLFGLSKRVQSQDLDLMCRFYNNSLQIAQITPFNSIALVYICPSVSHLRPRYIESFTSPIISFDIHHSNEYLVYLTDSANLYIANLDSTRNESVKLFQRLTSTINDSSVSLVDPVWTYTEWKPNQVVVDWVHDLLYLLVDHSAIYVSNMYQLDQSVLIIHRMSVSIKKLLICPKLSMIVWLEDEWDGVNVNSIQVAQQDGTEMKSIYLSSIVIHDIQVDQSTQSVYFITSDRMGVIPLKEHHQHGMMSVSEIGSRNVMTFPVPHDTQYFAILSKFPSESKTALISSSIPQTRTCSRSTTTN